MHLSCSGGLLEYTDGLYRLNVHIDENDVIEKANCA